jgi:hypothetical protein
VGGTLHAFAHAQTEPAHPQLSEPLQLPGNGWQANAVVMQQPSLAVLRSVVPEGHVPASSFMTAQLLPVWVAAQNSFALQSAQLDAELDAAASACDEVELDEEPQPTASINSKRVALRSMGGHVAFGAKANNLPLRQTTGARRHDKQT